MIFTGFTTRLRSFVRWFRKNILRQAEPFESLKFESDIAADWVVSQKLDVEWWDKQAEDDWNARNPPEGECR